MTGATRRARPSAEEAILRLRGGDRAALASALTLAERGELPVECVRSLLEADTSGTHVVGITGGPGAGKSTFVSTLVRALRARGDRVGVLAVDPSSPFSGGAVLGDRLRMTEHLGDAEVFIRSMASRGALGGLAAAVPQAVQLLQAWGPAWVLLETVGVGQSEVAVTRHADTVVLVLTPGTGDAVQAMKAGVMEAPHLVVVNSRADDTAAEKVARNLRSTLSLGSSSAPPEVCVVDAARGCGVDAFVAAIVNRSTTLAPQDRWGPASCAELLSHEISRRVKNLLGTSEGEELVAGVVDGSASFEDSVLQVLAAVSAR